MRKAGILTPRVVALLAAIALTTLAAAPLHARGAGHGGGHGGGHHHGGGFHGHSSVAIGIGFPGYWYGGWPYYYRPYYYGYPYAAYPYGAFYSGDAYPGEYIEQGNPADARQQPGGSFYYFCPSSNAYYPHVKQCPEGWQQVPLTPPG